MSKVIEFFSFTTSLVFVVHSRDVGRNVTVFRQREVPNMYRHPLRSSVPSGGKGNGSIFLEGMDLHNGLVKKHSLSQKGRSNLYVGTEPYLCLVNIILHSLTIVRTHLRLKLSSFDSLFNLRSP